MVSSILYIRMGNYLVCCIAGRSVLLVLFCLLQPKLRNVSFSILVVTSDTSNTLTSNTLYKYQNNNVKWKRQNQQRSWKLKKFRLSFLLLHCARSQTDDCQIKIFGIKNKCVDVAPHISVIQTYCSNIWCFLLNFIFFNSYTWKNFSVTF